jgi:hypothetical protein
MRPLASKKIRRCRVRADGIEAATDFFHAMTKIFLASPVDSDYVPLAQIRTCLWPCVDR